MIIAMSLPRCAAALSRCAAAVLASAVLVSTTACVPQAQPTPAVIRETPPPWPAPRDGVAYIEKAGLEASRLDDRTNQRTFTMSVEVDGAAVEIPAFVGVDRIRALQAPVHTHDASGIVWLEGRGAETVELGQFFTVWGVVFDDSCIGSSCGTVTATADGDVVDDPVHLRLSSVERTLHVEVSGP